MQNLKPRQGTPFSLGVRGYKEGSTTYPNVYIPELKPNNRKGLGNFSLTRINAFETPDIKPRFVDFEKAQLLDLENQGITVRLDDKTLEELLKIKIPDPTDTLWIAEDRRLRAQYAGRLTPAQIEEVLIRNKPLGREQRTITSTKTVGSSLVKQGELLDAINLQVQQGRATTALEQKTLLLELQNILGESKNLATFTQQQFTDLGKTMAFLNVPKTHTQLGLPRFVDYTYYSANAGAIVSLFLSNVMTDPNYQRGIDFDTPVYDYKTPSGLPASSILTMLASIQRPDKKRQFLDLEKRKRITYDELIKISKEAQFQPKGLTNTTVFDITPAFILKADAPGFGTA
jgi:hypothetical protein